MDDDALNVLYDVCATLQYNTERTDILEKLIKKIILEEPQKIDIKNEIKQIMLSDKVSLSAETVFSIQDTILTLTIPTEDVMDYIAKRYFPYDNIYSKRYGYGIILVSTTINAILLNCIEKAKRKRFLAGCYQFKNKEEYADRSFVELPSKEYATAWKEIITFDKNELLSLFPEDKIPTEFKDNLDNVIKMFSFTKEDIQNDLSLRFQETPIFKINENEFVVVAPYYLIRSLPQKHELLLKNCKDYLDIRGKIFEAMALRLLESLPKSELHKNIPYDKFEVDGILNLENSSWFVECTSHPPSIKSLLGYASSIRDDLNKTVEKCQKQATRAIANAQHPNIAKCNPKYKNGILIILEGVYPNLNSNNMFQFVPNQDQIPRYAINYFDLQVILRQPETFLFEEFLFWRTQKNMPIVCFDEKDYWAYFTKMKTDKTAEETFYIAQQKELKVIYISERFNRKDYLNKMIF